MTKALIAGGGIAGPAAAIALRKAGIEASLFEAYRDGTGGPGGFVTIAANGQDALNAIDAGRILDGISFPVPRLRFTAPDGTLLGEFPLGRKRPVPRTVPRTALSAALTAEAARLGARVCHGKRLVSGRRDGPGVTASFDDGTSASGDVLIGADGIHSAVRGLIDPDAPGPRYTGLAVATGYSESPPGAAGEPGTSTMMFGSRAWFGCIDAPDGRQWWFARLPVPEPADGGPAVPSGQWQERLAAAFDADPIPAAGIIRATTGPVTVTSARDIPSLPAWRSESMVLIGDAAHAASPATSQGVPMALEDAATLARCLRDVPDVPGALAAFEHLRRDRAERVVQAGSGSGVNPSPPGPGSRMEGPPAWILDHHIDWDEKVSPTGRPS